MWTLANIITLIRIALIPPFVYFVNEGAFGLALGIFFAASVSDFFDGYVARRFNQHSAVGRLLDPLADKILTTVGYIVLALPRAGIPSIPIWLAALVVGRDVAILVGSLIVFLKVRYREFKPSLIGKLNTFAELGLIVSFLALNSTGYLLFLVPYLYWIVATTVIASGLSYLATGVSILRLHSLNRSPELLESKQL